MTPERFQRITSVLNKRQPDLTVITDEVHKGRNLSAITRTCDAVGIDTIHCVMPEDGYQTYNGTSASAEKWVAVQHHSSISAPVNDLKREGFQLVAANLGDNTLDYRNVDYTKPTALVLGAEVKGVSPEAAAAVDYNVTVPMVGMVESFNVSVAAAIILMEAQHQRQQAGLYDQPRLTADVYRARFFHWAHPVLAKWCDDNGVEYPPVREDGEVKNLSAWYSAEQARLE
ncbi:tRNA (guanosine(18)-2'-O)-methyltransferase TrmH [Teredinibacter turnerae]|uniref:tRNA (guanosine(18)-2'-O)-methyltransferase n=1 Tax=Teredinibacter turnerae (strain ATCC 39867 / T7901) TaxID=377629 RepID=C5BJC4_TERTT|nr:tRNA (guanosine(18)-2'-O)-methyltransferase TrmH [Teredinibacter turnerae]ACR14169.1 tRNA guanosine-2'-O-methyltransferase [Teredinibacter turnerae T7901]